MTKISESERRQNYLRAVRFEKPDFIPMAFHINGACWNNYPVDALKELILSHPLLYPDPSVWLPPEGFTPSPKQSGNITYTDDWGCFWETSEAGIVGVVTKHPLENWDSLQGYIAPDPETCMGIGPIDWEQTAKSFEQTKANGSLCAAGLRHGHTFLQLVDIRGYQNLMYDMADEDPRLDVLIEMVEQFNLGLVKRYVRLAPDTMGYAEDLGMQNGPMLSPAHFRKYIKPSYQRLMKPAKEAGCLVHMHSDGDIRSLYADIVDGGVDVMNLQDLVNGIDWIKQNVKGKVCIELDIDRQKTTRFGTPAQIDEMIREEVSELGSPQGGLMMVYGLYHGVPLENANALMDAMERYAFFWRS